MRGIEISVLSIAVTVFHRCNTARTANRVHRSTAQVAAGESRPGPEPRAECLAR
jgi:hypothetical protein